MNPSPRFGLARALGLSLLLGARELAGDLSRRVQARASRWLLKHAGLDLDALDATVVEPPAPVDRVVPAPDDAPFLGAEASSMLASPVRAPASLRAVPVPEAAPLVGSVEERLAHLRLR